MDLIQWAQLLIGKCKKTIQRNLERFLFLMDFPNKLAINPFLQLKNCIFVSLLKKTDKTDKNTSIQ